jgi:hypothetical protein
MNIVVSPDHRKILETRVAQARPATPRPRES